MAVNKEEIEILFIKMMKDLEGCPQSDEIYQEDMKNFDGIIKLQWNICGIIGYQIFDRDNYSYKFGEKLDDPGVNVDVVDLVLAKKFLKCEPFKFHSKFGKEGKMEIMQTLGWKKIDTEKGNERVKITKPFLTIQIDPKKGLDPFMLSKLPMFRDWTKKYVVRENEFAAYIPINKSLGKFENQILPVKIFKHFIDKACNIVVRDCPCRVSNDCKDHEKSYGCMMLGSGTIGMSFPEDARVVTKEEALKIVALAVDDGLIPILGNNRMEADGYDVAGTENFMSVCFCCTCCCINGRVMQQLSASITAIYQRMEGLTVEVDRDICNGCGECLDVCVFTGMEMIDEKAKVNQKRCLGCGRCENICPNDAISIEFSDIRRVDELIEKLEAHVDVT